MQWKKQYLFGFIDEAIIWKFFKVNPENNLLQYLRKTYGDTKTEDAKETYALGTNNDAGIIFWSINSNLKVQKAKIAYYDTNGKRTNKFKVPYKNEDGYFNCLFGEHLIYDKIKIEYQVGEPETVEVDGRLMIMQNETSIVNISQEQLDQIIDIIERIRNKRTQLNIF